MEQSVPRVVPGLEKRKRMQNGNAGRLNGYRSYVAEPYPIPLLPQSGPRTFKIHMYGGILNPQGYRTSKDATL